MKRLDKISWSLTGALVAAVCTASADTVVSAPAAQNAVAVENLQVDNGAINGEIVNHTQHRLEQVELSVTYNWLWRNEHQPGDNNPGWVTQFSVPVTLAPGERHAFHYAPEQPLPARDDGWFTPSVGVVSYMEFAGGEAH